MALATQLLEEELPPSVMDVAPSQDQLARIDALADTVGRTVADGKLRCFAGHGLAEADRLMAREASAFILLLEVLAG